MSLLRGWEVDSILKEKKNVSPVTRVMMKKKHEIRWEKLLQDE